MQSESPVRIFTEPQVYIVGRQTVDDAELDRFLDDHGVTWESDSDVAAEVLTETAGRLCYMSYAKPRPGGNSAYLDHIKESGHGSVLEASVWNLIITNVSRSLTHELIRHRTNSFSQLSQRYVDESVAEYVEPDIIANDPDLHDIWLDAVKHSHAAYTKLADRLLVTAYNQRWPQDGYDTLDKVMKSSAWKTHGTELRKAARQAARSVLPNATETKIFVTANGRSLRHFCEQRGSRHADPEIRKLANKVFDVLVVESPNLFGDYRKIPLTDGTFELQTDHKKV